MIGRTRAKCLVEILQMIRSRTLIIPYKALLQDITTLWNQRPKTWPSFALVVLHRKVSGQLSDLR